MDEFRKNSPQILYSPIAFIQVISFILLSENCRSEPTTKFKKVSKTWYGQKRWILYFGLLDGLAIHIYIGFYKF